MGSFGTGRHVHKVNETPGGVFRLFLAGIPGEEVNKTFGYLFGRSGDGSRRPDAGGTFDLGVIAASTGSRAPLRFLTRITAAPGCACAGAASVDLAVSRNVGAA